MTQRKGIILAGGSGTRLHSATPGYAPMHERCVAWNDPAIGTDWPHFSAPAVAEGPRSIFFKYLGDIVDSAAATGVLLYPCRSNQ